MAETFIFLQKTYCIEVKKDIDSKLYALARIFHGTVGSAVCGLYRNRAHNKEFVKMQYIVKGKDEKEYGPVDQETLQKWVEHGRVMPDTLVRNHLIKHSFKRADELEFLRLSFAVQMEVKDDEAGLADRFREVLGLFSKGSGKKEADKPNTAYRQKYMEQGAGPLARIGAFVFDAFVLGCWGASLGLLCFLSVQGGSDVNAAFHNLFLVFFLGVLLYYGIAIGVYAQTFGMWFWGIMVVTSEIKEVYLGRAYFYTILMILLGWLAPIVSFVNPKNFSFHEVLSGTRVIHIAAKPKA